jgi:glycosyltransferase involved in cell wall biosynthesis
MITKNAGDVLEASLMSIKDIADEIVIIDNYSTDETVTIAKKYKAIIFKHKENDLGKQKAYGLTKVKNNWVLALDSDEIVTKELGEEVRRAVSRNEFDAFWIYYQNHFLNRKINYGGEDYKMIRLFKNSAVNINSALVHEKFGIKKGKIGKLNNKIYHYSYRSIFQMFKKFTNYAIRDVKQKKTSKEKTSLKKIFLYPIHMFWARFIEDEGYKDGIFRIPLDLGFAYMEFLTYFLLLF